MTAIAYKYPHRGNLTFRVAEGENGFFSFQESPPFGSSALLTIDSEALVKAVKEPGVCSYIEEGILIIPPRALQEAGYKGLIPDHQEFAVKDISAEQLEALEERLRAKLLAEMGMGPGTTMAALAPSAPPVVDEQRMRELDRESERERNALEAQRLENEKAQIDLKKMEAQITLAQLETKRAESLAKAEETRAATAAAKAAAGKNGNGAKDTPKDEGAGNGDPKPAE